MRIIKITDNKYEIANQFFDIKTLVRIINASELFLMLEDFEKTGNNVAHFGIFKKFMFTTKEEIF